MSFEAPRTKFETPDAELAYLREQVRMHEMRVEKTSTVRDDSAVTVTRAYGEVPAEEVVGTGYQMLGTDIEHIHLNLLPEAHDAQMQELIQLVQTKGVRNTLSVIAKLNNPHITDDFHRFLSEYIREGYTVPKMKKDGAVWKATHMTLLEITMPRGGSSAEQAMVDMVRSMEQLYTSMITNGREFSLEIATPIDRREATLFIGVPNDVASTFEKQLLALFPSARVTVNINDYNIFNEYGASVGAVGTFRAPDAYPMKTIEAFASDPFAVVLSAFGKLAEDGESAAVQIVVRGVGDRENKRIGSARDKVQKGSQPNDVLQGKSSGSGLVSEIAGTIFGSSGNKSNENEQVTVDTEAVERMNTKVSTPVVMTNIRVIASAETVGRAHAIVDELKSSFSQFELPQSNSFEFKEAKGFGFKHFFRDYSFRAFSPKYGVALNTIELATLYHVPTDLNNSQPELKQSSHKSVPAPLELAREGIVLGVNSHSTTETEIRMSPEDRLRHMYVIGQTGTGKTSILKNMIVQDIKNGDGVCMIDPHGSDIQDILGQIPRERAKDVIYFDPSHTEHPMGLNMLEYDPAYPEQKTFVVNELFSIFQKLYGAVPESMGPMFEQYFRNATMLVIEHPESGSTLLDVSRVLSDKNYRELKLSHCKNPVVVQFWREVADKAGGEAALANIVPYITSKFDVFLANDVMRPIVAQQKSAFDFRKVMDEKKILLVNLSKGRLGDINANLLGLIIVGKILMAALSRVDSSAESRAPFYLYIDEFQNVTTDSIATILSEARKYKLGLTIAHQFIAQLSESIKNAVFGNVGSMASFRVGADDAAYLENQFAPTFTANDLMHIDNYNAIVKLLANGKPVSPFNITTQKPREGNEAVADALKELSHHTYGVDRSTVEAAIMQKYQGN